MNYISNIRFKERLIHCLLQVMLPYNYTEFISVLVKHVEDNLVPMSRIDDAVRRILRVKFVMGLFEKPFADETYVDHVGSQVKDQ